ncbi:Gfo/Idh/MocA family protein [Micropruina glycogenica]|uniref:Dehydrogenase n=1 Tax=Micropruina glycogenica TaxID=75385 RepID=A0A2N9JKC9_9ACTN|nr:Gfo/Idh/MocA family oxidoreductase [Micropruina glycogenica]SPD88206.1 Dehydrogenase [Micropruina glycogenica]
MTDRTVRMGIIGLGAQGGYYAGFLSRGRVPNVQLAAICDTDESKREATEGFGVPFFTDYHDMLASGQVDAVVTTIPHYLHPEVGIGALDAGLHVLVEKPIGVYTTQARALLDHAAQTSDRTTAVMFNQRTNPLYIDLRNLIQSGELGKLRHTSWIITTWWRPQGYYDQSAWRATWGGEGGGVLVNQAPHQLDLWQWLCGVPKSVFAKLAFGFKRDIAVEDEVTALVDFGDGATGTFTTCTHDLAGTDRLEILFDAGKIVVDDSKTVTITKLSAPEQELSAGMNMDDVRRLFTGEGDLSQYTTVTTRTYDSPWSDQHPAVMQNFAANILDAEPLVAPVDDGIHGVRLANAIHLSGWVGEEVSITDFDEQRYLSELNKRIADEGQFPLREEG